MAKQSREGEKCPAVELMKTLSGKWKMHVLHLTEAAPMRFSDYMRQIEGTNKQSLSIALKELEIDGLLIRQIVNEKPLHVEYSLTDRAKAVIPVFEDLYQRLSS